jgi:hypothetical protein
MGSGSDTPHYCPDVPHVMSKSGFKWVGTMNAPASPFFSSAKKKSFFIIYDLPLLIQSTYQRLASLKQSAKFSLWHFLVESFTVILSKQRKQFFFFFGILWTHIHLGQTFCDSWMFEWICEFCSVSSYTTIKHFNYVPTCYSFNKLNDTIFFFFF